LVATVAALISSGCSGNASQFSPAAPATSHITQQANAAGPLAQSPTVNLLANGSYETGDFTSWQVLNAPPPNHYPCVVVNNPGVAAGEPTGGMSPDPVGTDLMACVADPSNESFTQQVQLEPGYYDVGFSAYPYSYQEPDNEKFIAYVGNTLVASIDSANVTANQWYLINGVIHITTAGSYTIKFKYRVRGRFGRDMLIDRVYLINAG
jgi:hypothetical protein